MRSTLIVAVALTLGMAGGASAKQMTDKQRLRAQAEHACYNDVQKLCNADIPDETKIAACMKANHAKLSAACRKAFDAGAK